VQVFTFKSQLSQLTTVYGRYTVGDN